MLNGSKWSISQLRADWGPPKPQDLSSSTRGFGITRLGPQILDSQPAIGLIPNITITMQKTTTHWNCSELLVQTPTVLQGRSSNKLVSSLPKNEEKVMRPQCLLTTDLANNFVSGSLFQSSLSLTSHHAHWTWVLHWFYMVPPRFSFPLGPPQQLQPPCCHPSVAWAPWDTSPVPKSWDAKACWARSTAPASASMPSWKAGKTDEI